MEVVQAYLLLTSYCLGPEERFEQDLTWLLLGLAIRTATDLNMHRKLPLSGLDTEEGRAHDREVINRERTWLCCFNADRSYSAQVSHSSVLAKTVLAKTRVYARTLHRRWVNPTPSRKM